MSAALKSRFVRRDTVLRIKDRAWRIWAMPQFEGDHGAVVAVLVPASKSTRINSTGIVNAVASSARPVVAHKAVPLAFLRRSAGSPDWKDRTPARPREIGGLYFDMRLVARALACLPSCSSVRVEVAATSAKYEGKADTLRIIADKWRVLVASMRSEGPALQFPEAS